MEIYKEKEILVVKETLVEILCDVCNKNIQHKQYYYKVSTGHYEWGNDSHESVEHRDICSSECLQKEFLKYIEGRADSRHIEVQREYARVG